MRRALSDELPDVIKTLSTIPIDDVYRAVVFICNEAEFDAITSAYNLVVQAVQDNSTGNFFIVGMGFRLYEMPLDDIKPSDRDMFKKVVPEGGAIVIFRPLGYDEMRIMEKEGQT